MLQMNNVLLRSIGIFLLSCFILYKIKHPKMFKPCGSFRTFGLNEEETITPFWLVTTLVGLTSYYLLLMQDGNYV